MRTDCKSCQDHCSDYLQESDEPTQEMENSLNKLGKHMDKLDTQINTILDLLDSEGCIKGVVLFHYLEQVLPEVDLADWAVHLTDLIEEEAIVELEYKIGEVTETLYFSKNVSFNMNFVEKIKVRNSNGYY